MAERVLDMENLHVSFDTYAGEVKAVRGVTLHVDEGEVLAIVGESGCGKSVTAQTIMKLNPMPPARIVEGSINLAGHDVVKASEKEMQKIRGKEGAMIFQDPMTSLNPVLRVNEQIAEVIRAHDRSLKKHAALEKAEEMLELVGIPKERGSEYPHQFSGGMKQRVVIAIALACQPDVLIADEPTTALDVTIQAQVLEMMKELRDRYGTSTLMITHDLGIVAELCDEVSVIYAGRIVEHGTLEEVFDRTLHPYTTGLFGSLPNMEDRSARLKPIKGLMPDPSNLPEGCAFCPRCEHVMECCIKERPTRTWVSDTHFVECHLLNRAKLNGKEASVHG